MLECDLSLIHICVEHELKEKGYDAQLTASAIYFLSFHAPGKQGNTKIMSLQIQGRNTEYLDYLEGSAPVLENEIAFSRLVLKENDWHIGDRVELNLNGKLYKFIITGSYSDYMQLGSSARLNARLDMSKTDMFEYWNVNVCLLYTSLVFSVLSLHHWKEKNKGINEIYRVLKKNGRLIIGDPLLEDWMSNRILGLLMQVLDGGSFTDKKRVSEYLSLSLIHILLTTFN